MTAYNSTDNIPPKIVPLCRDLLRLHQYDIKFSIPRNSPLEDEVAYRFSVIATRFISGHRDNKEQVTKTSEQEMKELADYLEIQPRQ